MGWWRRLRNMLHPGRHGRDLDRELAFHLDETADRLVAEGMTPDDAAREARRRFGHRPLVRERTRDAGIVTWLESLLGDVRYALRTLARTPTFTAIAILSLALGIGANIAIFSLVDAVLLRTLPVAEPERLVALNMGQGTGDVFTNPLWEAIRDRQLAFDGVFAFGADQFNLAPSGEARIVEGEYVSGGFFPTLGVRPLLGRLLGPADDQRGCPGVAVVSRGFWQAVLGGRADVAGETLTLNRQPFTIVGVAPGEFTGVEVGRAPQVYVPICTEPLLDGAPGYLDERSTWWLQLIGRLPAGVTAAQADAQLQAIAPDVFLSTLPTGWGAESLNNYRKRTLATSPAARGFSEIRARYETALTILMAVVATVLLIACANVANLLLARAAARERELSLRLAIGASRGRLIRQVLTESLLLAGAGALLGLALAYWGRGLLLGLLADARTTVVLDLPLDGRLLLFTLGVAVLTGLLFGLGPAWRSVRQDPQQALKVAGPTGTSAPAVLRASRGLVVLQVALSLVLVSTAGLLLGTFRSLATLDPGFDPAGVVLARLNFGPLGLSDAHRAAASTELLARLRALPGVVSASASVLTPVSGAGWNSFVMTEGYTPASQEDNLVWFNGVADGYFATMGTPLLAGRDFTTADGPGGPQVALVNQALARKLFGGANPLGRRITVQGGRGQGPPIEVVGVVGNAKYRSLRDDDPPTAYIPWTQADHIGGLNFEVRSREGAGRVASQVAAEAVAVLPGASVVMSTLSGQLSTSLARERLLAALSGFFGGLALLLALIGLYGTMAYNVTRRRKEIGIRVALGASRARLARMILGDALRLVAFGLVLGGMATVAATRLVGAFLYARTPLDPVTLGFAVLTVVLVGVAAGAVPALRATRQDPQAVLREE